MSGFSVFPAKFQSCLGMNILSHFSDLGNGGLVCEAMCRNPLLPPNSAIKKVITEYGPLTLDQGYESNNPLFFEVTQPQAFHYSN